MKPQTLAQSLEQQLAHQHMRKRLTAVFYAPHLREDAGNEVALFLSLTCCYRVHLGSLNPIPSVILSNIKTLNTGLPIKSNSSSCVQHPEP